MNIRTLVIRYHTMPAQNNENEIAICFTLIWKHRKKIKINMSSEGNININNDLGN